MSEFKLHHLIVQLIELLGSESVPERHLEKLQESSAANALNAVAPHSCIQHLAKISSQPELFVQKYEELKSKKVDLLGPFVQTLELISQDEQLKRYLSRSVPRAVASSLKDPTVTQEDLPKICKTVIKAAVEGGKKLNQQVCRKSDGALVKHNWVVERPRITWDFHSDAAVTHYQKVVPIIVSQESILLWDILYCLKGIDGSYIVSEPLTSPYALKTFTIPPDVVKETSRKIIRNLNSRHGGKIERVEFDFLGVSFKQLAQQILPLAAYYSMTVRFVEEKVLLDDGQVNHALRGAVRSLLKDYLLFVVQLETEHIHGELSLQKLWFYIQPTMLTMSILSQITSTICNANARGDKVPSLLHEQTLNNVSGEAKSKELCLYLIQAASMPYMQILEKWVYKGVICDHGPIIYGLRIPLTIHKLE
ncbi:PREDICTED: gamma-tubulin complex component 2-like [Vollenhovia emeryi]|uniref:gamma-tubulin complex component 2-like n=1 Tax=Vollenhovia emeryi TaxID=411798 RepID=UPI0005F4564A|nr:PREDICTED: gamma-tubulin complex component 2-like [Vollenhovia emeryi]